MASIIKSDNGVSSGITGIVQSADSSGQLVLQTTTSSGTATTAVTIDNTQVATFANTLKAPNLQGPAFFAYQNSSQSLTGGVSGKIQFQAKLFDTNSNFDSVTNYRFTPTVAGYYQISGSVMISTTTTTYSIQTSIFKNGTVYASGVLSTATAAAYPQSVVSVLVYFNGSTDYVELYGYSNATVSTNPYQSNMYFSGAMVRSA